MKKLLILLMLVPLLGMTQTYRPIKDIGETGLVFAYLSSATSTTITLPDRWYIFQSTFNNTILQNFTLETDGITYVGSGGYYEVEWMTGGSANTNGDVKIGVVKNGTFVAGLLDSGESILQGSGGADYADNTALSNGEVNPRSFWSGYLDTGDKLTLVILSTTSSTVYSPDGASASLHSIR